MAGTRVAFRADAAFAKPEIYDALEQRDGINYDGSVFTTDSYLPWMESPRFVWVPSIATSGMMIYTGEQFHHANGELNLILPGRNYGWSVVSPWWRGSAFVGGLAGEQLARVSLNGQMAVSEEMLLGGSLGRIRDVRQGPGGLISGDRGSRRCVDGDREAGRGRRGAAALTCLAGHEARTRSSRPHPSDVATTDRGRIDGCATKSSAGTAGRV